MWFFCPTVGQQSPWVGVGTLESPAAEGIQLILLITALTISSRKADMVGFEVDAGKKIFS